MAVYTGTVVSFLTLIAYNDDCVPRVTYSCVVFPTSPGVTYHIQVDGFNRQQGAVAVSLVLEAAGKSPSGSASGTPFRTLTASPSPGFQRPPNDAFVDAGTKLPAVGSSVGASLEEGEPLAGYGAVGSVWYRFLAPSLPASVKVRVALLGGGGGGVGNGVGHGAWGMGRGSVHVMDAVCVMSV